MTTRRQSRGRFRRSARTPTRWETLNFAMVHAAGASIVFADITVEPVLDNEAGTATIRRVIAHVNYAPVGLGTHEFAIGIAVVTMDAMAAGALPDPLGDFQQGWYYWTQRPMLVDAEAGLRTLDFDFDVRTMRKLRGGYRLALITETPILP